jgi:alkanesulfonate monooxygenase SsuD/methylene tetrahydromethanopterin reductase-like flavin-dependent oxidoreductase (luciferase family)
MAGALQEIAEGRFILGIGAGNQVNENTAFGHNFANRIGAFKEYLPIVTALLNGETVNFEGRYFQMKNASLRTVVPEVPVWVASGGPQMFALTAKHASGWNMAGGGMTAAGIKEKYDGFSAACRAIGKSARDFDVCKMTFMAVAADDAGAKRMRDELATKSNLTTDALAARMIVDTPAGITKWLRTLSEIGVTHHIFSVSESEQWPNYWDAVELLAREVVPAVRA